MSGRLEWLEDEELEASSNASEGDPVFGVSSAESGTGSKHQPSWLHAPETEATPLRSKSTRRKRRRYSHTDLLRYRAQRPICLTFFGVVHCATIVAGTISAIFQAADIIFMLQHSRQLLEDDATTDSPTISLWNMLQNLALRCYGVVFALAVVLAELAEFRPCSKCLSFVGDMWPIRMWPVRGLIYIFVGLFATESAHQPTDGQGVLSQVDSATALFFIHHSGTVLKCTGLLYALLGLCCCRSLKLHQLREFDEAQERLQQHLDEYPAGTNSGVNLTAPNGASYSSHTSSHPFEEHPPAHGGDPFNLNRADLEHGTGDPTRSGGTLALGDGGGASGSNGETEWHRL